MFQGNEISSSEVRIDGMQEKLVIQRIDKVKPGKITVKIDAGETKIIEIIIPEKIEEHQELKAVEVKEPENGGLQIDPGIENPIMLGVVAGVGIAFFLGIKKLRP